MAIISLEGMKFFSPIGFYSEERKTKNHFIVDLFIEIDDNNESFENDKLSYTLNYQEVFEIVKNVMSQENKLLEFTAHQILSNIKSNFQQIKSVQIKLCKLNPPLGAEVEKVCLMLKI
jgi:7,8-dihydroneopterin aldolase/epimerase/oxygenase